MNKNRIIEVLIIIASVAGLFLSVLLILEYFGLSPAAAEAVCSRGSGVNACRIVSSSPYAAIRDMPFIGDVPTALFGFIFYGFIAVITAAQFMRQNSGEVFQLYTLILILSIAAFSGDAALYLVSVFSIKFVCPLCAMTYAATTLILISSILLLKKNTGSPGESIIMAMKNFLKRNILTYITIVIVLASAGISTSAVVHAVADKKDYSYEERFQKAIRQYESEKVTDVSFADVPVFGKENADAKFVIFFDFTCSHCMIEFNALEMLMKKYPDDTSVSFRFFPLDGSCSKPEKGSENIEAASCIAFAAAFCSYKQGKFMEYAKILFDNYHKKNIRFSVKSVRDAARVINMNLAGFDLCFGSEQTWEYINKEYMETERLGLTGTPTVYLNGKKLTGSSRRADMLEGLVKYCSIRNK